MQFFNSIIDKARAKRQTIVLAEGEDPRIIEAASRATRDGIAKCILIGNQTTIRQQASEAGIDLTDIRIEDPLQSEFFESFSKELWQLRKHKGITLEQAQKQAQDPLCFADMMLRNNQADGSIAGARYTTGERVRSALQIVGVAPGFKSVSSFFLMIFEDRDTTEAGKAMIFSDCGLIIDPDAAQLAEIAVAAAQSGRQLLGEEPRVAMLSFSTDGSASHPFVDKVSEATQLARRQMPNVAIDGEIQLDAAIVPAVAEQKMSGSNVNGTANVLIFPNLEAGNIGYKLTQRFGGANAIGPILQGLSRPANDLSRGCNVDDVYYLIALTALQSLG